MYILKQQFEDYYYKVVVRQTQAAEIKVEKWDYSKLKNFCVSKGKIHRTKSQLMEQEKLLANHISDNGLIPYI